MGTKYYIKCEGFIGDVLFTSSVAKHLKEREPDCHVSYWTMLPQPRLLLLNNPYIDDVYVWDEPKRREYDVTYQMPLIRQNEPATYQFQRAAQIENVTLPFDTYTLESYDATEHKWLNRLRSLGKPIIAYQGNWDERSLIYTQEEYETGQIQGRYRDIKRILNELNYDVSLIEVGFPSDVHQRHARAYNNGDESYAKTASILKYCDWMIGAEGGLTNLSASVGCKTMITTEHMWRMFGPHGSMAQYDELKMGPKTYYPDSGHIHLNPYLTDDDLIEQLFNIL